MNINFALRFYEVIDILLILAFFCLRSLHEAIFFSFSTTSLFNKRERIKRAYDRVDDDK